MEDITCSNILSSALWNMSNKIWFYTSASNKLEAGGRDGGTEWRKGGAGIAMHW